MHLSTSNEFRGMVYTLNICHVYNKIIYVSGRSSGNYQIHAWSYRFLPKEERPSKKQKTSHDSGSEDSQDYRYLTKSESGGQGPLTIGITCI